MKRFFITAVLLLALVIGVSVQADENKLTAHFIDVGQGDSAFLELPDGKNMLIDAGTHEYGEKVARYIKALDYDTVDYLVATHPHADHIGGMPEVFEQLEIKNVYMPNAVTDTKTFDNLLDAIEKENCSVNEVSSGMNIFSDGELIAEVLAPVSERYEELNNYSVVIKVTYGETDYLFTGDCEAEVEQQLLSKDITAEVLKAGHHGSNTSSASEFVRRVNPQFAVISCGKNNDYGHPHRETIATFNALGIQMLRTDELGNIVITSDGQNINVEDVDVLSKSGEEKNISYTAVIVLAVLVSLMKRKKRR